MNRIVTLAALALMLFAARAGAQPAVRFEAAGGVDRLEYRYRFENESSFDTAELVPHFFEQRYERTAPQIGLRASYAMKGRRLATVFSISPDTRSFGSDFDTFFQPSGDRVTSGTAGDVDLLTWRLEQHITAGSKRGATFGLMFGYQRDRATFLPADRVVTHTLPPSETREFITDRERTVSQTFEVGATGAIRAPVGGGWAIEAEARLLPAIRARLLTQLPDKYPGRDIVFTAAAWSGSGRVAVARTFGRLGAALWAAVEQAGGYRASAEFQRTSATLGVSLRLIGGQNGK